MRRRSSVLSVLLTLSALASTSACSTKVQSEPAPETAADQTAADQATIDGFEIENAEKTDLQLVDELATHIGEGWLTGPASEQEILLTLKLRVNGKSAVISGGPDVKILTGPDAVEASSDITVDVDRELAEDLLAGEASLKEVKDQLTIDNPDGFDRFVDFLQAD